MVRAEFLALPALWSIASQAERVTIALILGLPAELPERAATPEQAWAAMNLQQRRLVLAHAPLAVRRRLPADPAVARSTTRRAPAAATRRTAPAPSGRSRPPAGTAEPRRAGRVERPEPAGVGRSRLFL